MGLTRPQVTEEAGEPKPNDQPLLSNQFQDLEDDGDACVSLLDFSCLTGLLTLGPCNHRLGGHGLSRDLGDNHRGLVSMVLLVGHQQAAV